MTQSDKKLIEALHYHVQNPSAWEHGFDEGISDLMRDAAARLRALTAEPVAAYTIDHTGCYILNTDIARIEKIAAEGSKGPTEVIYLYGGPPPATTQPDETMVEALGNLDKWLCQFLNCADDPADTPADWKAETSHNFEALRKAYNDAHKAGIFTAASPRREGWQMVPVEPTPDMLVAAGTVDGWNEAASRHADECHIEWWKDMLAAAPAAPQEDGK